MLEVSSRRGRNSNITIPTIKTGCKLPNEGGFVYKMTIGPIFINSKNISCSFLNKCEITKNYKNGFNELDNVIIYNLERNKSRYIKIFQRFLYLGTTVKKC